VWVVFYLSFATHVLGAFKIVSKIENRDSRRSPIKGIDGTFFIKSGDEVFMVVGEAKLKPDSNDGLREAQQDLNSFYSDSTRTTHELELASRQIINEVNDDTWPIFEKKFIQEDLDDSSFMNVIFVGYNFENFTKLVKSEISQPDFLKTISEDLTRCFTNQLALINQGSKRSAFCFLPLEDIEKARSTFLQHHNLLSEPNA